MERKKLEDLSYRSFGRFGRMTNERKLKFALIGVNTVVERLADVDATVSLERREDILLDLYATWDDLVGVAAMLLKTSRSSLLNTQV